MDAAVKEFGSIDIAVNFAGGTATQICGDRDGMELSDDKTVIRKYCLGI